MNKYNRLLSSISDKYGITKGNKETDIEWKSRIIYSICGLMAYASLKDCAHDKVSIVHFKGRIDTIFESYKKLYPEASVLLPNSSEELEDEISSVFINCGIVYHSAYDYSLAIETKSYIDNIVFERGIAIDDIKAVSGLGMYSDCIMAEKNYIDVRKMFGLEIKKLNDTWANITSGAVWIKSDEFDSTTEFLKLFPPYTTGYWVKKPDESGRISIMRKGLKGAQLYYLYRKKQSYYEISQLPYWKVENFNYRTFSNACLLALETLPPIEYNIDGALTSIHLQYLLPPKELNFLKLYSWPDPCNSIPSDFRRKISTKVFGTIKKVLQEEGFVFIER